MTRTRRRAYEDTSVSVAKSREEIDRILISWGVQGIQWEDNFDSGIAVLRFRWKREVDGTVLVARFHVALESEEKLREMAIDGRNGKFSKKKYDRLKQQQGKREHRVLSGFIKNSFEAIEEGIISAEALLMPWLEDSTGKTVYDKVGPVLSQLASTPLHKALEPSKDE